MVVEAYLIHNAGSEMLRVHSFARDSSRSKQNETMKMAPNPNPNDKKSSRRILEWTIRDFLLSFRGGFLRPVFPPSSEPISSTGVSDAQSSEMIRENKRSGKVHNRQCTKV